VSQGAFSAQPPPLKATAIIAGAAFNAPVCGLILDSAINIRSAI
jgi:hypothetical protein